MPQRTEPGTLHRRTLELLNSSTHTLIQIHDLTQLPYHWLRKFKAGEIGNPSVNLVQALYEFLHGEQLRVN
jgi:hypothetical protein